MRKLSLPAPLGYSSSGTVIKVSPKVENLSVGDRVCGGSGHAEIICVSENLCCKLSPNVGLRDAAFTTLGAIALQGIRQAKIEMGESVVVLGLGLVGLVTMKLLKAAGAFPIGVDIDNSAVNICRDLGFNAYNSKDLVYSDFIKQTVSGYGFDKSLITASTSSSQPFDFSIRVLRDRGHITVVGDLPIKFSGKIFITKN